MPRPGRPAPAEACPGWPEKACADAAVEKVRLLALAVTQAMDGRSIRSVAGEVGVDFSTLSDLLAGRTWPDSATVARLEVGLDRSLWPPHEGVED
ncbi:MAG: helix-turn-helix domain-containing protein [Humibacillus sp.]|nr:helix-turn-helix domain-containing protein [Humibacillus sp.]MDN5778857.1 helix-turn-helix domain-containing protein [Humibacillus sp.]